MTKLKLSYLPGGFPKLLRALGSILFFSASCLFCNSSVFLSIALVFAVFMGYDLQLFRNANAEIIIVIKKNPFINLFKGENIEIQKYKTSKNILEVLIYNY